MSSNFVVVCSCLKEAIAFNEHVSITYEHQQYQQFQLQQQQHQQQHQQLNLPSKKQKHQKTKQQDPNLVSIKNVLINAFVLVEHNISRQHAFTLKKKKNRILSQKNNHDFD